VLRPRRCNWRTSANETADSHPAARERREHWTDLHPPRRNPRLPGRVMDTADKRSAAGAPSPLALSIAYGLCNQVGDFLSCVMQRVPITGYEHWISPLAADKPADAEEGHGPNSPCLSVWKNRWVRRRGT